MCNEYSFKQPLDTLAEVFAGLSIDLEWAGGAPNLEPRESIRPTDPAPVLVGTPGGGAELKQLRWGFANPGRGGPVINFRSDGRRFPTGRCLVPVDGFYEFTGEEGAPKTQKKSKWLFTAASGSPFFCIAGLVRDDRFTMLTMPPGPDIAPYHDRQVVIPPRKQWAAWLGPAPEADIPSLPAGSLKVTQVR